MSWKDIDNFPGRNPKDTREWIANILDVIKTLKGTETYFDNPGTTIKELGAIPGKVKEIVELLPKIVAVMPRCSVTDFGAVGDFDGSTGTNNVNAFITAIDALPNYNGKIYIPEGKFLLEGQTLNCNTKNAITFEGSGKYSTILHSKDVSTLITKKSGTSILFKDLSIVVETVPQGLMKLIDLKAIDVHFENVNIVVNPVFESMTQHSIISTKDCPFTSFKDLSLMGTLIPEDAHEITGQPCYSLSSIGIISDSNELITFSNVFVSGIANAIKMIDEEGSYIDGLILENVYKGVEYNGTCIHNTICGMRYKSNVEAVLQLQNPDDICAVSYSENSRGNTIVGRTHETYSMLYPHNAYVIDLGRDNKYDSNMQSKVYKKFPVNQLIVNNNFKYWKDGVPLNWSPINQRNHSVVFTKVNDENVESGGRTYTTISNMVENLSGIKTDPFIYDPDIHGDVFNISFKAKLPETDAIYKILICDATNDKILIDCELPTVNNLDKSFIYPCVGKWDRYTITKNINSIKRFLTLKLVCVKPNSTHAESLDITDIQILTGDIGASEYPLINNYNMLNGLPDDIGPYLTGETISLNPATGFLNAVYIIPADSNVGRWALTNPLQCLRYV